MNGPEPGKQYDWRRPGTGALRVTILYSAVLEQAPGQPEVVAGLCRVRSADQEVWAPISELHDVAE